MSWSFIDVGRGFEVAMKWSEISDVMQMMTVFIAKFPFESVYDIPLWEFDFEEVERVSRHERRASLSCDFDRERVVEVVMMTFDHLDRKGIALKFTRYYRGGRLLVRRSSSEDDVRVWEREMEERSLGRRDNHNQMTALERSYLETRRRSRDRRMEEWREFAQLVQERERENDDVARDVDAVDVQRGPAGSSTVDSVGEASGPTDLQSE